jgi:hypothetical protein
MARYAAAGLDCAAGHPSTPNRNRKSYFMIANAEPIGARADATLYHLEVTLEATEPRIWRRLQVPANANLGWLHAVIQVAMGWTNSHLHQFRAGEALYSDLKNNYAEFEGDPEILDENKATLQQLAPREKDMLVYEYDFGDSWIHELTVEKIVDPDPAAAAVAKCLDGARACPPEDCGGVWGYADLLKIIKNPKHKERKSMMEWLGREFDPVAFNLAKANTWLRKLKWPRTTESHLRKVLMARDGYKG